jgi:hypothetical protein
MSLLLRTLIHVAKLNVTFSVVPALQYIFALRPLPLPPTCV